MSRAAFFDAITTEPPLVTLGLNPATVFHNYSSEERPTQASPFVILRWGEEAGPIFGSEPERGPRDLTMWVHFPSELTTDYNKITRVLDAVDDLVPELRDVVGVDGYTLSFVTKGGRSPDLRDEGFNTLTRYADYKIFQTR